MKHLYSVVILASILTLPLPAAAEDNHAILKAIHSEEVRNIMRRLNILLFEREMTQLELQRLRQQQMDLLIEEAESLKNTATMIPVIDSLKGLNDEQQVAFNAMAQELYEITVELKTENEANHHEAVDQAYIKLQKTCNTCHLLFRSW